MIARRYLIPVFILIGLVSSCGGSSSDNTFDAPVTPEPTVKISSPKDGTLTNQNTITVRGVATNTCTVMVNNIAAKVEDNHFSTSISLKEGKNIIKVTVPDTDVSDSVTVNVDLTPPSCRILSPKQGEFFTSPKPIELKVNVNSSKDLVKTELDGMRKNIPPEGGSFTFKLDNLTDGLNIHKICVWDLANNMLCEHTAFMYGQFIEPDNAPEGSGIHIGPNGYRGIADVINNYIGSVDFTKVAPDPLYDSALFSLKANKIDFKRGEIVTLKPDDEGIALGIKLVDLKIDMTLKTGSDSTKTYPIGMTAEQMSTNCIIQPKLNQVNDIEMSIKCEDVDVKNLQFTGVTDELLGAIPGIDQGLKDAAPYMIKAMFEDFLPKKLTQLFKLMLLPRNMDILGHQFTIKPLITDITAGPLGLDIYFSMTLSAQNEQIDPDRKNKFISFNTKNVDLRDKNGIAVALSADMMNYVMYKLWQYKVLDFVVDQQLLDKYKAEISLVAGLLGTIPKVKHIDPETPMKVVITPLLWPFFDFSGEKPIFKIGSLNIQALNVNDNSQIMNSFVSLQTGILVSIRNDLMRIGITELDLDMDVEDVSPEEERDVEGVTTGLFSEIDQTLEALLNAMGVPNTKKLTGGDVSINTTIRDNHLVIELNEKGQK